MMRAGGHAILNWITSHFSTDIVVFNNLDPDTSLLGHRSMPWRYGLSSINPQIASTGKRWEWVYEQLAQLPTRHIKTMVYSYEDRPLATECAEIISPQQKCVVIRDCYNWLASRLKAFGGLYPQHAKYKCEDPIKLWKQHAITAINRQSEIMPVLYNKWFASQQYREELETKLNMVNTDKAIQTILNYGGGSSFDGMKFNQNAQQMKVGDRWKEFIGNEEYIELLDDEMCDISDQMFPECKLIKNEVKKKVSR